MTMKINKLTLLAVAVAAPIALFAACGGDDSTPVGPQNQKDSSVPDTSPTNQPETGPGPDSGADTSVNPCSTGIVFDNKASISSWPNVPPAM
jgi:hypothetical protein